MSFGLVYTRRAVKDIQKLDQSVKARIGKALLRFAADPLKHSKRLTNPALGTFRFRIGDYRVVFDLDGDLFSFRLRSSNFAATGLMRLPRRGFTQARNDRKIIRYALTG